nr:hypothetical protein BaRGS_000406 [Batillaria attramentaria]
MATFLFDMSEEEGIMISFPHFHLKTDNPCLDTGLFNCSVPHYTSFSLHFDCNLETECTAGEDERNCDYTSDTCERQCRNEQCVSDEEWCDEGYCLPVYLRCNGIDDCSGREDETDCDSYTCPGFYRCYASSVCVHVDHVCDGVFQCPEQDDELLCDLSCPQGCDCQGLAFNCNQTFSASSYPDLRYLDASTSGMTPDDLTANVYLVRLILSACGLVTVPTMTLPNLRWLDLSANVLTSINMQTFVGLKNLRVLCLSANPLASLTNGGTEGLHVNLHTLDLSLTDLDTYNGQVLVRFPHLTSLNMSHGALTTITVQGLNSTPGLEELDVRHSPLEEFPHHLLRRLSSLHSVYASNFKLCCAATLPENFNLKNCHAPMDEIASCDDLLRSNAYRGFLWVMASMAIVGNAVSFAARIVQKEAAKTGFHVFVTNLSVADFLMGVYLAIIGVADQVYRGIYLWNDKVWKGSVACQIIIFLSVRKNTIASNRGNQDATIARRLTSIALSDFLCWFPIGLLGLLASKGTPISGEVNVAMVIFVLPLNSALNPFLYTFNVIMEKRRKAAEGRLLQQLNRRALNQVNDARLPHKRTLCSKETQTDD